jgi:putative redox protein
MKVTLERINDEYLFEAKGTSDIPVLIDNKGNDVVKGSSPMELLLMGIGGCSAIDIILILKKQHQEITSYKMVVEGIRKEEKEAKPFKEAKVVIYLEGSIDVAKAIRAADLSFEKYCSVSITLEPNVTINYEIILNGEKI